MSKKPPGKGPGSSPWVKGALFLTFGVAAFSILQYSQKNNEQINRPTPQTVMTPQPYSEFVGLVNKGLLKDILIRDQIAYASDDKGNKFTTYIPNGENLVERTIGSGTGITAMPPEPVKPPSKLWQAFISFGPILLIFALIVWMIRSAQKKQGGMNGFNKSKAKMMKDDQVKVTFDDVAGIEDAKEGLEEMVAFLRDPSQAGKLGGKAPTGALLVGPPGTGKTLIAKAVAGEAKVPFFSCSGSDFVEMFVGTGAARVRDLFEEAKKAAPCIIFIDEIDAVGKKRGQGGPGGGNDEREQTLNQILVEMDGFEGDTGIIVLAATNRSDVLDPALKRPGRFDREVQVNLPDLTGREKILGVHVRGKPLGPDVSLQTISRGTPGFSGAELANLVNEAALLAARRKRNVIMAIDFEDAKDKVMMGAENRTLRMSEEEVRLTAYHEAGHAIIAVLSPESDPIHKATIVPRGGALGMVIRLPERDRVSMSRAKLKADLAVAYGGREAEEMIFGYDNVTTGASGDIRWATDMAKRMVREWGMSDKLSARRFMPDNDQSFVKTNELSEELQKLVDSEIDTLLDEAQNRARTILTEHHDMFCKIAEALIKYETLTGDEVRAMVHQGADIDALKEISQKADAQSRGEGPRNVLPDSDTPTANDNDAEGKKPDWRRGPGGGRLDYTG